MRRQHLDLERLHQPGEPRRLAGRQLEHEPRQRGGVDDRVLERTVQPAADQPGVEGVVAVLNQDRTPGEMQERTAGVREVGGVDQHLAVDQVAAASVGVDRRPRVDEGVEERQRPVQAEPLGADLEHQKGPVAGGLDVHSYVLGLAERSVRAHAQRHFGRLLPLDRLSPARLEPQHASGFHGREW